MVNKKNGRKKEKEVWIEEKEQKEGKELRNNLSIYIYKN